MGNFLHCTTSAEFCERMSSCTESTSFNFNRNLKSEESGRSMDDHGPSHELNPTLLHLFHLQPRRWLAFSRHGRWPWWLCPRCVAWGQQQLRQLMAILQENQRQRGSVFAETRACPRIHAAALCIHLRSEKANTTYPILFKQMSNYMESAKIQRIGRMAHLRFPSVSSLGPRATTESLKLRSGPDARCSARCLARFGLALRHHRPSAVISSPRGPADNRHLAISLSYFIFDDMIEFVILYHVLYRMAPRLERKQDQ